MKKTLLSIAAFFVAAQLFAVTVVLPEGTSVNAYDVIRDGDDIVEVRLRQLAVLNTPLGALECVGAHFYKSGKIKACSLKNEIKISTDIGDMHGRSIEFYESGSLKQITLTYFYYNTATNKKVRIENKVKTCFGEVVLSTSDFSNNVTFYDSGSVEKALLRTFYLADTGADITYTCNAGRFNIDKCKYGDGINSQLNFMQYPSGKLKRFYVADESFEIKTPLGKGVGKSVKGGGWEPIKRCKVELREDGSVRGYVTAEPIKTEVAGLKFDISSGSYITFYSNGNICDFYVLNNDKLTVNVGSQKIYYMLGGITLRASKDGKKIMSAPIRVIRRSDGAELDLYGFYESMGFLYDNGIPGQLINEHGGSKWFDSGLRYEVGTANLDNDYGIYHLYCYKLQTTKEKQICYDDNEAKKYYLQRGDDVYKVGMVYFAADGTPSGYSMYKLDDFGELLIGEDNQPIVDAQNKKEFSKIE